MRHFGVLIPSTNTTVEIEYSRMLPADLQMHVGRLGKGGNTPFLPSLDADVAYQAKLLGTAKVEVVALAQTSASLFSDDYDDVTTKRMQEAAGVPALTSAVAIGQAVRALGARRIALVSPVLGGSDRPGEALLRNQAWVAGRRDGGVRCHRCLRHRQAGCRECRSRVRTHRPARDRSPGCAWRQLSDHAAHRRMGTRIPQAGDYHQPGGPMGDAAGDADRRLVARPRPPIGADACAFVRQPHA